MIILAIETSCDDTCVAVLKIENLKLKILSNIVSSQVKLHAKYGGVWPFLAKREHQKNLPIVFEKALKKAKLLKKRFKRNSSAKKFFSSRFSFLDLARIVDIIAVTTGPGLEPCLWQGVNFAKDLAGTLEKPIIPVNHLEAHIFSNFLVKKNYRLLFQNNLFPAVCLIVSGGHTQLILMKGIGNYQILGETRDDAAGECFDKVARILNLGYPGGPVIAKAAEFKKREPLVNRPPVKLPRPMINQKNYDFSFSGLKTAVLYLVKNLRKDKKKLTLNQKKWIAAEVQQSIIDVLIHKTKMALKEYKAKVVILGGGVTANEQLRKQFRSTISNQATKIKFLVPEKKFCTDNAAMVGLAGYFRFIINSLKYNNRWKNIEVDSNLKLEKINPMDMDVLVKKIKRSVFF